ncbi:unnamed protein product [Penicillium salamii]|nr:unnamed protein product [Penicillium salamii]CAG8147223.1 unnamed protein product [Penicillium salamii]CAG8378246.1 unnamed protein product [Penicillium salamii]CAG8379706.1 unnamed protein product [Penicillium salamii]
MPPLAGEERLVTLFADIHYYFTEPTQRPLPYHHRFDKGSFLYIYHNAAQNKARIEIANNPGSPGQDAFCGHMDNVHIRHTAQFPTLCTLTVEGMTPSPQQQQYAQEAALQHEWRLPSGDPRDNSNDFRDFPRLHTLDIYFWGTEDSTQFLDAAVQLLSNSQVETDREPAPQPEQPMSSVVQQLESVAVSDPAYQNGQTRNSRSDPMAVSPAPQGPPQISSFPPPPPSGMPTEQRSSNGPTPAEEKKDPASFAPLPYNPAAPAAPEPIQHREKTPPPEDGMVGTGLAAAVAADNGVPYTPPNQIIGGVGGIGAYASPPPSNQGPGLQYAGPPSTGLPTYASPPPSAGLQYSNSFSVQPTTQSPGMTTPSHSQSFLSGQGHSNSRQGSMSFAPPPQDPNAHLYDQQVYGGVKSQTPPQSQVAAPGSGFSNYSHSQSSVTQPQQLQRAGSEYDIHSQVYRPTEIEAGGHNQKYAQKAMKNPGRSSRLEEKAERLEGGMNRFLRKLERKL